MQFLVVVGLVIAVLALVMTTVSRGSSGYPANVNQVKQWIAAACQNKNNTAWPGNVQFACSDQGRNMLWAFSLMTADANANYTGKQPGAQQRNGLMPVPAALGEQYALALNALRKGTMPDPTTLANQYAQARRLHQMYNQNDPVLSLQVAALILNTDVGGTVAFGYVQQGLMGDPQNGPSNCTRYTGSAEQTTLSSGLTICKQDLTPQGQEALVEDLLGKWVVPGSSRADQQEAATAAQAAAVLYRSPDKPDADAQRAMDWIAAEHKAGKLLV